jgi:hypothetical protein
MAKDLEDVITIMRRVIGQNDGDDANATQTILLDYVTNFYELQFPQDLKLFDLYTWWEFNTASGTDTYTFKDQGYSNIGQPVYVNNIEINFYQDHKQFYDVWPLVDAGDESTGQPTDVLFYNDELLFRPQPDNTYAVKVLAYQQPQNTDSDTDLLQDYYLRYLAYGAALDYLADFGDFETYGPVKRVFDRYRDLVLRRTAVQRLQQRPMPAL